MSCPLLAFGTQRRSPVSDRWVHFAGVRTADFGAKQEERFAEPRRRRASESN
jgi:hypothetical protein